MPLDVDSSAAALSIRRVPLTMYVCVCASCVFLCVCLSGGVAVRPPDVILQNWIFRCTALLFRQLFASSSLQWFWIVDIGSVHDQMERPSRRHTYVYLYKLILILYTCVWERCHTAKLRYQLYLMFSNFLIYPSCYFRFAFVCVDQPQAQTVVHTHTHTRTHNRNRKQTFSKE